MWKGFKVIDADAHMQEPFDLWSEFIEPEFYDRRPIVNDYEGKTFFHYAAGELFPEGTARGGSGQENREGRGRLRPPKVTARNRQKFGDAWEADWSAESRLKDMDRYGWDKMVCIPGTGAGPIRIEGKDQALIWAITRAWNNWAHHFCSAAPSRLKMVGDLPNQHDIETLVTETRRCVEQLGAVTVTMPTAAKGKVWSDPEYDPFWALAVELDFPVSFHGVMSGDPHTGMRYRGMGGAIVGLEHAIGFPMENMISMGHLIYTGVLERHPELRVSFLEGSAGWLPFWLGRLDDHAVPGHRQEVFFDAATLPLKPSEYFFRQGFVACDGDESALKAAVDLCGDDHIVWNTDYPHPDAPDPDKAIPALLDQPISEEAKRKILWDNPARLYGERILS